MEYVHDTQEFNYRHTVVTLGKFDGLHKGHQLIFDEMSEYHKNGYRSVVFSFDRPPGETIKHKDTHTIFSKEEKIRLLANKGIDVYIEHPFTDEFSHTQPEDFITKILIGKVGMEVLIVGDDCGFGYKRRGNVELLKKLSHEFGFVLKVIPKLEMDDEIVSSTRIRRLILEGRIEEANELMTSNYMIMGTVVKGNDMGRNVLGIPTANQIPSSEKILPPNGVYVSKITFRDSENKYFYGISNIGVKPTIEGKQHYGIETYIFNFKKNIYHKDMRVELLYYRRREKKFDSLAELGAQMKEDIMFGKKFVKKLDISYNKKRFINNFARKGRFL